LTAVVDACSLKNFAAVDAMSLLRTWCAGDGRWTCGVEIEAAALLVTGTEWLGKAISVGEGIEDILAIENYRRLLGALRSDRATKHLGEAEVLFHLDTQQNDWIFVTDDQSALDFARRRGLTAIDTAEIMADCFERGLIGCPAAYELLLQMRALDRGVRVPPDHWQVCPPR
jgi:predicted nucleic acid-binding protein